MAYEMTAEVVDKALKNALESKPEHVPEYLVRKRVGRQLLAVGALEYKRSASLSVEPGTPSDIFKTGVYGIRKLLGYKPSSTLILNAAPVMQNITGVNIPNKRIRNFAARVTKHALTHGRAGLIVVENLTL